jgi:hypothetical protein
VRCVCECVRARVCACTRVCACVRLCARASACMCTCQCGCGRECVRVFGVCVLRVCVPATMHVLVRVSVARECTSALCERLCV